MDTITILVLYPGGSEATMEYRCKKADERVEELKNLSYNVIVAFAGFKTEMDFFKKNSKNGDATEGDSYDSVSNLRSILEKLLKTKRIIICTGYYHWRSFKEIIIPKVFPELQERIEWLPSDEPEGLISKVRFWTYKLLGPRIMEQLAIITRWQKFIKEYAIPLHQKANANAN